MVGVQPPLLQLAPPDGVEMPEVGVGTVAGAVLILLAAYALARASAFVLTKLSDRFPTRRIGIRMATPIIKFGIYIVAVFIILDSLLELTTTQVLAFSGVLGAALGFGLRDLFAGMVGGLVIILERPYRVGDKVEIKDHYGEITDIGLRATRIETPDDDLVSVPNYVFFTDAVANANAGNQEMMVVTEFMISPEADIDRAQAIVEEAVVTSRYVYITDDCPYTVSMRDRPYYYLIRVRAYVNDHRYERALISDITERVFEQFQAEEIPKPRGIDRDLHGEATEDG